MTDTGQVPGEGLPESAGMVEQPGVHAPGAYTYLSETSAEDEELLLPGAQGAWGNEVPPPAPEPVVQVVHEPGPHETDGRDSGAVDLSAVRTSEAHPAAPEAARFHTPVGTPVPQPPVAHRPPYLGPPTPGGAPSPVRSLADRGPAGAPTPPAAVRHPGPPVSGPEYFDTPQHAESGPGAAPWGAAPVAAPVTTPVTAPGTAPADVAEMPAAEMPTAEMPAGEVAAGGTAAETVVPQGGEPTGPQTDGMEGSALDTAVQAAQAGQSPELPHALDGSPAPVPATPGTPQAEPSAEGDGTAPHAGTPAQVPVPQQPAEAETETVAETGAGTAAVVHGQQAGQEQPAEQPQPAQEPAEQGEQIPQAPQAPQAADDPATRSAAETGEIPGAAAQPEAVQPTAVAVSAQEGQLPAPAADAVEETAGHERIGRHMQNTQNTQNTQDSQDMQETEAAQGAVPAEQPAFAEGGVPAVEPAAAEPSHAAPVGTAAQTRPLPNAAPEADADQPGDRFAPVSDSEPAAPPVIPAQPLPAEQPFQGTQPQEAPVPAPAPVPAQEGALPAPAEESPAAPAVMSAETTEGSASDEAPAEVPAEAPIATVPAPRVPETPPVTRPDTAETPAETAPEALPEPAAEQPAPAALTDSALPTDPVDPVGLADPADPDPDVVQSADDLDTRAADQEDQEEQDHTEESVAVVAEAGESAGPAAPGYDDAEREAVLRVMRERRDIRNGFRSDPIPHEVLLRVLEAAHTAPSVGHSQPWDFVVIRSAETRRAMHELAQRQREAYAKSLPKGRAKQFKELKIEAILDTPVNIVVTADPTRGGRHTLGRHTQPQMAPYSSALAVENLWLAARAEGLGVGWVSFFDEREMVRALDLPEHLEVVAYLCVGYVDEFPDEPELMQAGWSKRRPLSWVVHEETYGRRALPGAEPHDLLAETVAGIRPLDAKALGEAWERQKRMTKPAGALGMLEIISAQLSGLSRQCPPPIPEPAAVAVFAGDHGVHAQGVTPWPQEVTAQMVANFLGGGAVCNAFASQVGAEVCVVDVGVAADLPATPGLLPRKVRAGTADMTTGPALTREEVKQAIEVGIETARDLVAAGNKALLTGEMGIANTTASAALISVFTETDPAEVTGRGTGINDETLSRKTEVVRRAIELHQPDPADPIGVLAAFGGLEHAAMVGLLLGGASLRTPVILDGVSAGAAALVARAIAPEVLAACIAGHRSAEPGHVAALKKLGLRPLVDLDLRLGEGTGALLALPMVQSTARAMHEVATFDSAGVTEK